MLTGYVKRILKILAALFVGFIGGAFTPFILGWINTVPGKTLAGSDAIAIANTYIVFTTIIFVGITVLLAVAGYVFTEKLTETKEAQITQAINEIKKIAANNESIGISLIDAILQNGDVKRHFEDKLNEKLNQLIKEKMDASKQAEEQVTKEKNAIETIGSRLGKSEDKHE